MREVNGSTTTHGRVLIQDGPAADPVRLLIGFHGYAQNADEMLAELRTIAGTDAWTIASVQALHRFYRARSETTVASWLTRQDREILIDDNIAYVDAVVSQVSGGRLVDRLVLCGFSQGVAMAFRAAVRGRRRADAVLVLGGDVPPELLQDPATTFPAVLLARGSTDKLYTHERWTADARALEARGGVVHALSFGGGHEWSDAFKSAAAALLEGLAGRH